MKNIAPEHKSSENDQLFRDRAESYRIYVKTSAVGIEVALSVGIGIGGGYAFDRHFGTAPAAMLVGVSLGSIAAGRAIYYFVKKYLQAEAKKDREIEDAVIRKTDDR